MRLFRAVFIVLLISLGVTLLVWGHRQLPPAPVDLGIDRGFSGDLMLSKAEIESALSQARSMMLAYHRTGLQLKWGSDLSALLAFLATSAVTLILGWWGRAPPAGQPEPASPLSLGVPVRAARWIGFLAAIAAVMTGFGHFASESAQTHFTSADRLRDQLDQTRKEVVTAKSAEEARDALDRLVTQIGR